VTPEEEERVRRALAEAGAGDRSGKNSTPPEVVARLDEVLDGLVVARGATGTPGEGGGDDLARHRRRRWAGVLVAAAALAAIALGGPAVLRGLTSTTGSASTDSAGASSAQSGSPPDGTAGGQGSPPAGAKGLASGALPPPELRSASLRRDVERAVVASVAAPGDPVGAHGQSSGQSSPNASGQSSPEASGNPSGGTSGGTSSRRAEIACDLPAIPPAFTASSGADVIAVRLDGRPATLVVAAPRNGTRVARVYACNGGPEAAATTRISSR
jgi:hypothetical protein